MPREEEVVTTAKEFYRMIRELARLPVNWNAQPESMKRWYMMLARRAEGLEEKLQ